MKRSIQILAALAVLSITAVATPKAEAQIFRGFGLNPGLGYGYSPGFYGSGFNQGYSNYYRSNGFSPYRSGYNSFYNRGFYPGGFRSYNTGYAPRYGYSGVNRGYGYRGFRR